MTSGGVDPIAVFYDEHPYPPRVADLGADVAVLADRGRTRVAHHLIWPGRAMDTVEAVLVAGCGTSQAVRYALRRPETRVVGIDVSGASLDHARALAARHGVDNLELRRLAIEDVGVLGLRFDHVVCTGVVHHLADPVAGLRELRDVLAPQGAMTLMLYARHGRVGIEMIHEYCCRLGVTASVDDLSGLMATLRELPPGHPLGRLLRVSSDFADDDAIADALCNPRARNYDVGEVFDLLEQAGLRFGRWERQAPYLPDCGAISETPHSRLIAALAPADQYALVELFRGTISRHTLIAHRAEDDAVSSLDFTRPDVGSWLPIPVPTAVVVHERLPPGAAAALLNRAHIDNDLVLFVDERDAGLFDAFDGRRTIRELGDGAATLAERCWRHDLVVIDTMTAARERAE